VSEYAPSVQLALAEFIDDLNLEQRHGTARTYARTLAPLARLELDCVARLTPAVCREMIREQSTRVSDSTLATFAAVLRSFCRWCVDRRYLLVNPTDGLPKPKQRRPPHRWLTAPQLRAMFDACRSDTDRLVLLLCGGSGLRAQELLTLKWSRVDFECGEISVLGKGKKWRTLAPGALAMEAIRRLKAPGPAAPIPYPVSTPAGSASVYVMPYRTNDNLGYHVGELAKRAGVGHCTTHMLRHSFAVNYLQADGSAFGLQQLLGHSNPTMTAYYVRDASEELARREQKRVDLGGRLFG
jgi:prepilin-type processing-associated H-X9-DG protein